MTLRRYIAEFLGTFFLVLTICMTTYSKVSADIQPIAIGMMLIAMIYAMGYISGGQFNPAVTVALFFRGRLPLKEAGFYVIAQVLGGIAAAFLTAFLISAKPANAPVVIPPQYFSMIQALVAELIGTFALVWVILNVGTSKSLEGNNFYGLTIGFVFTALIYTLGGVSGGAFNPVIAISACIAHLSDWNNIWIYLVANLAGGALAAILFKFINVEE